MPTAADQTFTRIDLSRVCIFQLSCQTRAEATHRAARATLRWCVSAPRCLRQGQAFHPVRGASVRTWSAE